MLEKAYKKILAVLLALMILLPLATTVIPMVLNPPLVRAASSAAITLDVSEGYVGDYVTVNGSGFNPGKDITFTWGDNNFADLGFVLTAHKFQRPSIYAASGVHTDALGNFIVQLQVPKLTRGDYTIVASDTENSATASFTIQPLIRLRNIYAYKTHGSVEDTPDDYPSSPKYFDLFLAEGFVYDLLGLQLSGFGRGEIVEVKMGTTKIGDFNVGSTSTTEGYKFESAAGNVPNIPGGTYTVTAIGTMTLITATTTFTIKPELFLAEPPPSLPPPAAHPLAASWVYSYGTMGLGWYTSIGTTAGSAFVFEATGLTGTSISSVSIVYSGIAPIACTLSGTLTLQVGTGSTQGIDVAAPAPYTAPRTSDPPFGANSPVAQTPTPLVSGKMLNVTITTAGVGAASFTFTNQLFLSTPSTSDTAGSVVWVEGDSTIASDGTSLSGFVGDKNKLVVSGLKASASSLSPALVYSKGSTVQETDVDVIAGMGLTLYDQDVTPVGFYDAIANAVWDADETVYVDNDNSGTVTAGDDRVTLLTLAGSTFLPWSTVGATDPDLARALFEFPKSTRPGRFSSVTMKYVYLDRNADAKVSKGDTRISTVFPAYWTGVTSDLNGFIARTLSVPSYPGARSHGIGLWNRGVGAYGVQAGNSVTMQIMPYLSISAPTRYQSTHYVTEGSSVDISGNGFFGAEPLTISVGGKYVTTLTGPDAPTSSGVLSSTSITMPALAGGERSITAQGKFTVGNTASANVNFTPALSVSPTSGYNLDPVTSIMVTGKGFEAGLYQIVFDGAGIGEAVTSSINVTDTGDKAGQINIAFNLPEGVEGKHIVDVVNASEPTQSAFYGASYFTTGAGSRTGVTSSYPYPTDSEFPGITVYPSLQASPIEAIVGASVMVTGKGLQPSTTYYIWYDPRGSSTSQAILMTTTPTTVTTDAKGTLTASFQVPKSSGGSNRRIWVSTSQTHVDIDPVSGAVVYTNMEIEEALVLTPSSGPVGTTVSVTLSGLRTGDQYQLWWYKSEKGLPWGQVSTDAIPLATVMGDTYGNATEPVSFNVPATAEAGIMYTVDLSYYDNRDSELPTPSYFIVGNIATTITPTLTPTTVTQGQNVTINGIIEPAMSVNITLYIIDPDGTTTNKTVTSTSSGTFTDSFKADKVGIWQVIAEWDGDATFAGYTSLAATVTVKSIDMTWAYMLTGLIVGIIALVSGLLITYYYFRRKRLAAPPTA